MPLPRTLYGFAPRLFEWDGDLMRAVRELPDARGWIRVGVRDGVVELEGEVPSLSHKRLAGALGWWVPGTRDLDNELVVTPPEQDDDGELTDAVRMVFEKDPLLDESAIGVRSERRVVHLSGAVPNDAQREVNVSQMYENRARLEQWAQAKLEGEAQRVRGVVEHVEVHVAAGFPDEEIIAHAERLGAKLIVIAALGDRDPSKWQLGSRADRVAQHTHVPTLVVRELVPFETWARGMRPLRVALAVDFSVSSQLAARWVAELARAGAVEVVGIHFYWPAQEAYRLGLLGWRGHGEPDPVVAETLERELRAQLASISAAAPLRLRLEPHVDQRAERLAQLAQDERADLIVVGSHERGALARLWEESVSRGALRAARCSVVCVPVVPGAASNKMPARVNNVLAATDFSPLGDAAVSLAYAIAAPGATVHVVHVADFSHETAPRRDILLPTSADADAKRAELITRLRATIPSDASAYATNTELHVLESAEVALAIFQAAERLGVDVLCLGTHGRTGLARVLLGSVTHAILELTGRPLLLARAPMA